MIDRWMRVVLPWWWQGLLAVVLPHAACGALLYWLAGGSVDPYVARTAHRQALPIVALLAGCYGVYRVAAFHPLARPNYRRWLQSTPWTCRQSLPEGPIHLSGQDAVIVGGLACSAAAWDSATAPIVVQVFLTMYAAALGVSLALTGERAHAYATGFGIGLAVRLAQDAPLGLAAAAGTCIVATVGLRRSLARFPWSDVGELWFPPHGKQPATIASEGLGWPFAALGPRSPSTLPARDALLLGALGGWWMHCAGWTMDSRDTTMVLGFVLGLSPLARLLCYLASHLPPISLWGRIRTGRWVIPGYDRVFIAPLAAWAGGALLLLALHSAGVAVEGCAPVVVAFVMATVLGLGPGRREWQLTGQHRIVFHPAGGVVQQGGAKVG